jgi:tRNA A37 methylthiotransferase MiaB
MITDVGFDQAFTYSYSRRDQTYAGLWYKDDVEPASKSRRLTELIDAFQGTFLSRAGVARMR